MGTTVNMAMSISSMPPSSTNSPAWQSASCAHTSRMDDVDTRMMIASMDINVPTLINVSCTFHCSVSHAGVRGRSLTAGYLAARLVDFTSCPTDMAN